MNPIDILVFCLYLCCVLGVGLYFFHRNKNIADYYIGGRSIRSTHVGLSIVATDVGGGFSIGLGGVGYLMGLAGSWLLFTGLVGAWLSAVLIIPRIKAIDRKFSMYTYPDFLATRFNRKVVLTAALISGIGYLGFTSAQILAGAKLASQTIIEKAPLGLTPFEFSLLVIAFITISYTVLGGLKAVVYTDTIQWLILLSGLILVALPLSIKRIGGLAELKAALPAGHFNLFNLSPAQFINWMLTIIPIWFVAMTLYQRMFSVRNEKEARRAWYIAGIFEYPVMAFMGVLLGMCSRVFFPEIESELGIPLLIKNILPVGLTGLIAASYFSAIMSTADSCMMASSANFVKDLFEPLFKRPLTAGEHVRFSQLATLVVGIAAVVLASRFTKVLDAILYAYSFMVSGLFIPTLGALFWKKSSSTGALAAMAGGGGLTLTLLVMGPELPWGLDPTAFGMSLSLCLFIPLSLAFPEKRQS